MTTPSHKAKDGGRVIAQVLAELELCSHVSAVNLDPSSHDAGEDIGGKRPPGGIDRREDRFRDPAHKRGEPERVLRSAQHFREQLARGKPAGVVLDDALQALSAWRRQPPPGDKEHPMPGDFNWKRWVSESALSDVEIARRCFVSRQYVHRVRVKYRDAA